MGALSSISIVHNASSWTRPLLATAIGSLPSGPEFLHIRYQGARDKVVDHAQLLF